MNLFPNQNNYDQFLQKIINTIIINSTMGSCVSKDPTVVGRSQNSQQKGIKRTQSSATNSQNNKIGNNFGLKKSKNTKSLIFNHAPLKNCDFLFEKFKKSDGTPEEVNMGFMVTKCAIDIKNKEINLKYINSSPMKIWAIYGGIEKVSQTGLTVQIKDYKQAQQIRISSPSPTTDEGCQLPPIKLTQQPKQSILIILQPQLPQNQTIFMIYRYQIIPNQKQYTLITQSLQWCSLCFRISDIYGSEYLFKCNDENEVCSVCLTNKSECILMPCRHMCVCSGCLQVIEKTKPNCPLCRKEYYSVIKYKDGN